MNATTSPQTLQRHLRLPAIQRPFSRADLVFLGLEHSETPERRPADLRPPYALTPITKHVTVTEAVRQLVIDGIQDVDITIVPILHDVPAYIPEELLEQPVVFQRLSIVLYD